MARTSPTSRTLAYLRADGWTAEKVEQRLPIPGRFVTRDLFGCIDIVAIKPGTGILGVQATTSSNVAARITKIRGLASAAAWLASGGILEVWGWRLGGPRGKAKTWQLRRVVVGAEQEANR